MSGVNFRQIQEERARLQRVKNGLDNLVPTLENAMGQYALVAGPGNQILSHHVAVLFAQYRLQVVNECEPLRVKLLEAFPNDADIATGLLALRAVSTIGDLTACLQALVIRYGPANAVALAGAEIDTMIRRYEHFLEREQEAVPTWAHAWLRGLP